MKTVAFALLVVLVCGLSAFASDCIVTSYDQYIGGSCGIDNKTFSNFTYSTAGSNHMNASDITVTPITTQYNTGFQFIAPWNASSGQTQQSLIGYTATDNGGPLIKDLSLLMIGAATLGNAQVAVAETYCAGDTFANLCANGTEGTLLTILNSNTSLLSASVNFDNPVSVVDVYANVEMLGGSDNNSTALLGGLQNQFSEVPEPGSLVLFGSGIAGLAGVLRRYVKL
ncbi:MAG: PEP-CTERM sorting domain-containing protein [Candidatus Korobacteraceae bacterium]